MDLSKTHELTAEGLELRRGTRVLANRFDLTLRSGEIVAAHGASGSGKTTLLRGIAGLIPIGPGRLRLDGKDAAEHTWPSYRARVTYLNQQPAWRDGSVAANLARPFAYRSRSEAFPKAEARELLQHFGLSDRIWDETAENLSVGEQQRVALVRALMIRPWFVLLDEPTSALDPEAAATVMDHLRQQADSGGLGALLVSHDADLASRYADRTVDFPGDSG